MHDETTDLKLTTETPTTAAQPPTVERASTSNDAPNVETTPNTEEPTTSVETAPSAEEATSNVETAPNAEEPTTSVETAPNAEEPTPSAEAPAKRAAKPRKRVDAASMSKAQKEISVSEFFAKNRHLLGFDNPRKALLTAVKEAVDNSLDACEEAGVLPEIWVALERVADERFRVCVQDSGPGIEPKQIPLVYGKLLYGSKFHRLRMSRGQQGIGISAAAMYGLLTTGKPTEVVSKTSEHRPPTYFVVRINSKTNAPEALNGGGRGETLPRGEDGRRFLEEKRVPWVDVASGTLVIIELAAKYQRGRGSVDEYLEQTALSNPHATIHYVDPDGKRTDYPASVDQLPPEPIEIQPHPYGVELGKLLEMTRETDKKTMSKFLVDSFCRVSPAVAATLCQKAGIGVRTNPQSLEREDVAKLFAAIASTRIPAPSSDCVVPIGEQNLLTSLRKIVPGEFFTAATRPPAVYRGYPFQIEVALAYGGGASLLKITRDVLQDALAGSDARTIRQFLSSTFDGVGTDAADKIIKAANVRPRVSPGKLTPREFEALLKALQTLNLSEGQTTTVFRYANRAPLQFQASACAITQTIMQMNWRQYGLQQTRGQLPRGPLTIIAHFAGVWAPYTSESKEALASYPEIQKELQLALRAVGRKLGLFLKRRERVKQEGSRRAVFMRYLPEIAEAIAEINRGPFAEKLTAERAERQLRALAETEDALDSEAALAKTRDAVAAAVKRSQSGGDIYMKLLAVANRKTALADARYDDSGNRIDAPRDEFDELDSDPTVVVVSRDA